MISAFIQPARGAGLRGGVWGEVWGSHIAQRRRPAGLTVARLHALGVAVLLRVPGDGAHVGHGVALCMRVRVRGVGGVARHVGRRRVVLCMETVHSE